LQKGTFVVRLADVVDNDSKFIWRIDNHQLIHKYMLDDSNVIHQNGFSRRYVKTYRVRFIVNILSWVKRNGKVTP
jgi:hypothetical protein